MANRYNQVYSLAAVEGAGEVGADKLVPALKAQVGEKPVFADARVVHKQGNLAQLCPDFREHSLHIGRGGNVAAKGDAVYFGGKSLRGLGGVIVIDCHAPAVAGKSAAYFAADPAGAAGNKSDFLHKVNPFVGDCGKLYYDYMIKMLDNIKYMCYYSIAIGKTKALFYIAG